MGAGLRPWSAWLIFLFAALFLLEQTDHGGSPVADTGAQAGPRLLLVLAREPLPVALATWPTRASIKACFGHLEERRS